jgi:hypothetical protein
MIAWVLASVPNIKHVNGRGAEEGHVPSELLGLAHRADRLTDHRAEQNQIAAVGLHLGDLRAEIGRAALKAGDGGRLQFHNVELLGEAVEHVFAVLVVLVHDAGLREILQLFHIFQRSAGAFDTGRFCRSPCRILTSVASAPSVPKSFTLSDAYTAQSADPRPQSDCCRLTPGLRTNAASPESPASISGIFRLRFTAPKYLRSMVRFRCKTWIVPRS